MSYTPQTWANGDIITATKLNNIESGVQSVSNSYTPTTWVNGDIITATKLNNIEQGIANAGGGSSDFSTAEVTVEGSMYYTGFLLPHITEAVAIFPAMIDASSSVTDGTYTVPLYKGELDVVIEGLGEGKTISTTGDIEADGNVLFITGDCTITISIAE